MAEADIAFAAAAGAAGLALSVGAWAWRLRRAVAARESIIDKERRSAMAAVARHDGAAVAFDDVRIGLSPGEPPVLVGRGEAQEWVRTSFASDIQGAPAAAIAEALHARYPGPIEALLADGTPFETRDGDWRIEGSPVNGTAWVRLTRLDRAVEQADLQAEGLIDHGFGAGLIADASPAPTWVVDHDGRLI